MKDSRKLVFNFGSAVDSLICIISFDCCGRWMHVSVQALEARWSVYWAVANCRTSDRCRGTLRGSFANWKGEISDTWQQVAVNNEKCLWYFSSGTIKNPSLSCVSLLDCIQLNLGVWPPLVSDNHFPKYPTLVCQVIMVRTSHKGLLVTLTGECNQS